VRIGFDASAIRGNRTGVEHYARRLLDALRGVDGVEVVSFSDHVIPDVSDAVVRPSPFPLAVWRQLALPALVRESECATLHSPVTAVPLRLSVPVVATVHDLAWRVAPDCYGRRERLVQRFWLRAACRRAARVVCVSETTRSDLIACVPAAGTKAVTVHNGAVAAPMPPADHAAIRRALARFAIPPRFILAVGRIERRKNPAHVLRAFACAAADAELADLALVFAGGSGNASDRVRALARDLGIADRVMLCGYVADDLAALYQAAELLVYVSRYEGFGHPPFEAISLGTPVIASDIPVSREVLDSGGLLVAPDDVDALAAALRRVLRDATFRAQLIERGRERLRRFRWDDAAQRIADLHRDVVQP
jgi:glycosyltransferase involved in cell wall biosynthesis